MTNISNALSLSTSEKDVKEQLIEKVLENMSGQTQLAPVQLQVSTTTDSKEITAVHSTERKMVATISARSEMKSSENTGSKGLGNSAPLTNDGGSTIPSPPLPPSGCPDYDDLSNSDINNWILHSTDEQIESALMHYFESLSGPGKTDPTALMKLMNFIAFLSSHNRPDGTPLIDQNIANFLDKSCNLTGSDGKNGGIALWARQMADYAFAAGYKGLKGEAAREQWIKDEQAAWGQFPSNKWTQDVENCLGDSSITNDPNLKMDAQGNVTYTYDGVTYYWNNNGGDGSPFSDRDLIMMIFNGHSQEINGVMTEDPFYSNTDTSAMEKDYRTQTLNALLKEFKDPIWAVMMFFMKSTDDQFQAQMSGHAREEDDVSDWQTYATTLNEEIQKFQNGTATAADAHNFVRALYGAKIFVDQHPDLFSLNSSFKTNVFDMINNIKAGNGSSIQDLVTNVDAGNDAKLAMDLNAIFDSTPIPPNANDPTPPSTVNGNAQTAINAGNTFSSEVTGQSKNDVTIQAQDASTESALNKVGGDMDQLNSQLGKAFVNNQKSQ